MSNYISVLKYTIIKQIWSLIFDLKIELLISQENGKSEKKGGKEQLSHYNRQSRRNQSTTFFILEHDNGVLF